MLSKAKKISLALSDSINYANCLMDEGIVLTRINELNKAIVSLTMSQKILEKAGSTKNLSLVYSGLGSIFSKKRQFAIALDYY